MTATLYDRVDAGFFRRLVDRFYEGVGSDVVLAGLYSESPDFSGARHRLASFLEMYWGGPTTYLAERGHPRLRLRHMPFPVGPDERDRWLAHMSDAVEHVTADLDDGPRIASELMGYFTPAADQLRNDWVQKEGPG